MQGAPGVYRPECSQTPWCHSRAALGRPPAGRNSTPCMSWPRAFVQWNSVQVARAMVVGLVWWGAGLGHWQGRGSAGMDCIEARAAGVQRSDALNACSSLHAPCYEPRSSYKLLQPHAHKQVPIHAAAGPMSIRAGAAGLDAALPCAARTLGRYRFKLLHVRPCIKPRSVHAGGVQALSPPGASCIHMGTSKLRSCMYKSRGSLVRYKARADWSAECRRRGAGVTECRKLPCGQCLASASQALQSTSISSNTAAFAWL